MSDEKMNPDDHELEQGFNDDELQDIMNEIDSLEQEFEEAHLEAATPVAEEEEEAVVHSLPTRAQWPMQFEAQGQMDMKMSFNVAGKDAQICVTQNGLEIVFGDVQFHISEEDGCHVELPGGIKFTLPVAPEGAKKAA